MLDHSVTCHPTQLNAPSLNPNEEGWYSIYLSRRDGRLSWLRLEPVTAWLKVWRPTPWY